MNKKLIGAAALVGACALSFGQAFDWQSVAAGTYSGSVTMTNGGNSVEVSGYGATASLVYVDSPSIALLGSKSGTCFDGAVSYGSNIASFWDFTNALSSVTFLFGDSGGDDDGTVTISAYDAANNYLGDGSAYYGTASAGGSMTLTYSGMDHFIATCGGPAPGSVFFEVSASTMVPEPASIVALLGGAIAVLARRRR